MAFFVMSESDIIAVGTDLQVCPAGKRRLAMDKPEGLSLQLSDGQQGVFEGVFG